MNKITKDKIASQVLQEISDARLYKEGRINQWHKTEEMYYAKKTKLTEARSNIGLSRMQEFVHTLLSKIDEPLMFKFKKTKNSQLKRAELLNSLKTRDRDAGNWDMKDLIGKKQGIMYGRAIYAYYADSINKKYESHLEPIDVYDFLIDPNVNGYDLETALYMGDYTVYLNKKQLRDGVNKGEYNKEAVRELIDGIGNANDNTPEEQNKTERPRDVGLYTPKNMAEQKDVFKFWRWFTTYEGERYYMLIDNNGRWIKCEKWTDISPSTKEFPLGAYPYWSWSCFPDMTEFWTPSYCDYAREIFMAEEVAINQMFDNNEQINKPMRLVNVNAIENLAEVKYRRGGVIRTKKDLNFNQVYQTVQTPSITTPINVYQLLETIVQKATGVTDGTTGTADEDGKVGIYEGNQQATADRFNLLNKTYAHGYKRFARLYEAGVREHLIAKVAVEILGPNGVELKEIKRNDLFRKGDDYGLIIEASNSQELASIVEKRMRLNFYNGERGNPIINQKKLFELSANQIGLKEDEIDELLDVDNFGNQNIMAECDRDIERLLDGEDIKLNENANNAYKEKMYLYLRDNSENLNDKQYFAIADYLTKLQNIIIKNELYRMNEQVRKMRQEQMKAMIMQPQQQGKTRPITVKNNPIPEEEVDITKIQ